MGRIPAALAALALAAAGLAGGCGTPVAGPTVVLTLATSEEPQEANGPEIQMFAHEVDVRSGGTIRIDVRWNLTNPTPQGSDQALARQVADGRYDLGVVPARAWDVLGVATLRPLTTPFLLTSDAAVRAVLAADVRDDLLAGLPAAGVTGLDLWPGQLRRFFGIGRPIVRPADLAGAVIRSPRSRTVGEFLESLGATPVETAEPEQGSQRGLESSFAAVAVGGYRLVATGNVVLFPRVETLVADDDLRPRLEPGQWQVLVDAAAEVRRHPPEGLLSDEDGARAFCRAGGRIVAAGPTDASDFVRASRTVRDEMAHDPDTAGLVDEIEAVVATVPAPEPVVACPDDVTPPDGGGPLDGIYLARVTRRDMTDVGVVDPTMLRDNVGTFTWVLDDGTWRYHQVAKGPLVNPEQSGRFTYEDGRFTLFWGTDEVITARLDVAPDGTIRFRDLHDNIPELQAATEGFFGVPWRRVGDLPG